MTKICFNIYNKEHLLAICKTYKIRDERIGKAYTEWWYTHLIGPSHTWLADTEKYGLACYPETIEDFISRHKEYVPITAVSIDLGRM